ncbi:E3 ubiquitin-protein ligase Bre1 isoform X4 [Parasteatoda tepidariorum]|uniref:E3 ubiquitin-protein ligase Bre1 isoform X3 n=1 Tax=Parasteatoda tepidariorum TaxID=114398 RepID=UPI000A2C0217|nr:E3 ubiquitin-protein ligase Bre1 isoform X4 [Parasteatoda tepidariorum]XP_042898594.1 E3 ubiquitin-protein ligase Bre1 isoform X5 [Parasteatoda tepidariorum]XP_042898595.1 E3 ubiquitin-protein ligase Bre1 isoform X6 [Parasteatoda tepidariorum]
MSTKRPAPQDNSAQNSAKRVHFEPCRIGSVSTQEEMDMKVLQFQNRKLTERLEQRQRQEADLRSRIEQLEKRQTSDEAVLCVVNRYWNQLNEDLRILLQRFDAETSDESETQNEEEATTSFLALLGQWDKEELDEKLAQRVQVSTRAVAKVLQAFDRIVQRNHKIMLALKGDPSSQETIPSLDDVVRQTNVDLQNENKNLHLLVTGLHEKHHQMSLKFAEINDKLATLEIANAELKNHIEDLEYDLSKTKQREEKLDMHLSESITKLKSYNADNDGRTPVSTVTQAKLEDLQKELEEQKELSNNRLVELETLNTEHKEALKLVEKLKMDLQCLPESVVVETTEYKCLQSQFSVLYNESMQLKTLLEETRNLMATSKNTHLRHIEQLESEELSAQRKLRNEAIHLEDALAQTRKEYEMLRVEFEQNLAANEQTDDRNCFQRKKQLLQRNGPINREMRHLITSLQNHNHQLKGEVQRYKRKLKEATAELAKLQPLANASEHVKHIKEEPTDTPSGLSNNPPSNVTIKEEVVIKKEKDDDSCRDEETDIKEKGKSDAEIIRDLKSQLKKSQEAQRELKLLLDMYKGAPKEQRDKAQLMAAEKKARAEVEELRNQIRKNLDNERKERRKLADEEALKKIKALEDSLQTLQKTLASQKQEEEALLNEMDITGQAFEDMQEQNLRLMQQLREKDDANFKLMSERIKSNQIHKLLREEKSVLMEQVITLKNQVDAQNQVVRKLEEKERLLQTNVATVEKELSLRQQSAEMQKRKSIESAQSAADLRLHLEKYLSHLKEAQAAVAEKTSAVQQEAFKTKRLQEEIISLRRKVERGKRFELATTPDEVLAEEVREYKEQLTCPSCKVKRKDAVLTKCFHVFCFDCLKTRYETRQRKCPKCNANFGANDFHRLYLA